MKIELNTDLTVKDICEGFYYNDAEEKGVSGWGGKLVIQPEYQRNYVYKEYKKDGPVIESILKGYPIGLIYFVKTDKDKYEILDGQQRITSIGRFATSKLSIRNNTIQYDTMDDNLKNIFDKYKFTIYICEGTETEIKEWFKTINTEGVKLNDQEILNAIHSGSFVTLAKKEFSNSQNSNVQKWAHYISGEVKRQDYLKTALSWVSKEWDKSLKTNKDENLREIYMSKHRRDDNITELKNYFNSVIDWVAATFQNNDYPEMKNVNWGRLYEIYHENIYEISKIGELVEKYMCDECVNDRAGIFEYVLGGCKTPSLLKINVRAFSPSVKKATYIKQTNEAKEKGISNCPLCAIGEGNNKKTIYSQKEMDADHVTAWSKGGTTDISNCQMLCITHNRAKGNR